jgi:hypothetical protein
MTVIRVRKPPASAMNPDRPVPSLLKTQIAHLQEAEFRLPRQQTNICINKIKTEGQATEYIRQVKRLHPEGASRKVSQKAKGKVRPAATFTIAAMGDGKRAKKAMPNANANANAKTKAGGGSRKKRW